MTQLAPSEAIQGSLQPQLQPAARAVRVLLADDHSIFRQSLCVLLQQEGF